MRTLLLAIVLFAIGYGSVMLGQQAVASATGSQVFEAISRQVMEIRKRASGFLRQPQEPIDQTDPTVIEREAGLSGRLVAADLVFVATDQT